MVPVAQVFRVMLARALGKSIALINVYELLGRGMGHAMSVRQYTTSNNIS